MVGCSSCSISRSHAARSSRSTWPPTPRASRSSTWRSWATDEPTSRLPLGSAACRVPGRSGPPRRGPGPPVARRGLDPNTGLASRGRPTTPAQLLFACWPWCVLYSPHVGELGMKPKVGKESMPKPPTHTLIWSAQSKTYALVIPDHPPQEIVPGHQEPWLAWLTTHSSFSFQGQSGHLSVLKQSRPRGAGYWYAYHTKE